ncbi:MAG: PqiC family protein [Casimicrobiaceae bacterium]
MALASGCASPPSRFYTLSGATANATAAAGPSIAVGPVSIPAVVDRPEIVVTIGENEVWLDEFNRWASPLADGISATMVENLSAILSAPRVALLANTTTFDVDFRVAIEVQRFESIPGSSALIDAVWNVRRVKDGVSTSGRAILRENAADRGYDALAAAHSRAVARLSQDVADAIRRLASSPAR